MLYVATYVHIFRGLYGQIYASKNVCCSQSKMKTASREKVQKDGPDRAENARSGSFR